MIDCSVTTNSWQQNEPEIKSINPKKHTPRFSQSYLFQMSNQQLTLSPKVNLDRNRFHPKLRFWQYLP